MIKILKCKNKNYLKKLKNFLYRRQTTEELNSKIVTKILNDIKKDKFKALLKYEKKFSKNSEVKISLNKVNSSIESLNPKIKKAIDYSYKRIFNFHSKQKFKNISYKDNLNNKLEYKYIPIQSVGIYVPANFMHL